MLEESARELLKFRAQSEHVHQSCDAMRSTAQANATTASRQSWRYRIEEWPYQLGVL